MMYILGSAGVIGGFLKNRAVIIALGIAAGALMCAGIEPVHGAAAAVLSGVRRAVEFIGGGAG